MVEGRSRPIKGILENWVSLVIDVRYRWSVIVLVSALESVANGCERGLFRE
jgi:hypothetical protein